VGRAVLHGRPLESWKATENGSSAACAHGAASHRHYFGALQNWVKLQNDPQYECFFSSADWHALTLGFADTSQVAQNTIEIAIDWLASGLDPAKCTMFIQSSVPEHAELHLLLSMVTPLGWLERVPTYKKRSKVLKANIYILMDSWAIQYSSVPT